MGFRSRGVRTQGSVRRARACGGQAVSGQRSHAARAVGTSDGHTQVRLFGDSFVRGGRRAFKVCCLGLSCCVAGEFCSHDWSAPPTVFLRVAFEQRKCRFFANVITGPGLCAQYDSCHALTAAVSCFAAFCCFACNVSRASFAIALTLLETCFLPLLTFLG